MANAIFTTKLEPSYDDIPELRYHFPARYLRQAEQTIGDWIIYYEPRRQAGVTSQASGSQCYFAMARVVAIERDPNLNDHYYARISDYQEFTSPVPFRDGNSFYEQGLRKDDGSTNKGRFGWSLRVIPKEEYLMIRKAGFSDIIGQSEAVVPAILKEDPIPYGRPDRTEILERAFRDVAFTRVVRKAYESTCAMTGLKLINGGGRCEIEAAHIRPVEDEGPDSPRNGVALSRTVHWMFDRGILSIGDKGEILMARKLVPDQVFRMLNPDLRVRLPSDQSLTPHPVFLRFHREQKFKGD